MAGDSPLVSVVVPVYNGAPTIGQTLASALAQTLADLEVIVVDDGSTDDTAALVGGIADARVCLHRFANAGLPASRNRGVGLARGEFIAFLDADDLWTPDKLASQVAALRAAPEAALAYSLTDCIDEGDRFVAHGSHVVADGRAYEQLVLRNFLDNGSTPLIRSEALRAAGPFDVAIPITADWDMWLRLAFRHEIACVPRVQVLYRVHGNAMSSNVRALEQQSLPVLSAALARVADDDTRRRLQRRARVNLYLYFAGRALRAVRTRADAALAAGYALEVLRRAGGDPAALANGVIQLTKSAVLVAWPGAGSQRVLARLAALRGRPAR